jgi:hypothetical protein
MMMIIIGVVVVAAAICVLALSFGKRRESGKSEPPSNAEKITGLTAGWASGERDCVYFSEIADWLKKRQGLKKDSDTIAFSLLKKTNDGKIDLAAGFFNTKTEELLDGVKYSVSRVDPELEKIHNGKELVIYE